VELTMRSRAALELALEPTLVSSWASEFVASTTASDLVVVATGAA
jgi:hypothetical protein